MKNRQLKPPRYSRATPTDETAEKSFGRMPPFPTLEDEIKPPTAFEKPMP